MVWMLFLWLAAAHAGSEEDLITQCDEGDASACVRLAGRYQGRLGRACGMGSAEACRLLAEDLAHGPAGQDPQKAGALADRSCALGVAEACLRAPNPPDGAPVPPELSVIVSHSGFRILGADATLHPDGPPDEPTYIGCRLEACVERDALDWQALYHALKRVKEAHPHTQHIAVAPEGAVSAEILFATIDLVSKPDSGLFPRVILAGGAQ